MICEIINVEVRVISRAEGEISTEIYETEISNVEKPTVVSPVRQISRLQLDENEKSSKYFFGAQKLMSRLTKAGEKISETFNALVVNGLPEKYEHFIVQESFNPAANSPNYEHANKILMTADSKETKEKKGVQQLCILIYQVEIKVQASQRETVLCADILVILPSNVTKRSSAYCSKCKKRGTFTKSMSK